MIDGARRLAGLGFLLLLVTNGSGCSGILSFDDLIPGNCAIGPTAPIVPDKVPTAAQAVQAKIFMSRGLLNSYSLGLDILADKMKTLGFDPVLINWPDDWQNVGNGIDKQYEGKVGENKFVIIGHSYGSDDAVRLARMLRDHNIPVRLLFLLDASAPDPIPPNVDLCIHYYIPTIAGDLLPDIFAGNPVVLEDGNTHTELHNDKFIPEVFGDGVGCSTHFSIDVNTLAHNKIIEEVLKLVEP